MSTAVAPAAPRAVTERRTAVFALPETRWAAIALVLFAAGLAAQLAGAPAWTFWTLYLACYAAGGWEPGLAGLRALRERTLDVDLLMVAAAIGAAAIGQITDGALLIVIFATSGALEALATARTEDAVRGLLDLSPDTATRIAADDREERVPAAELAIGDLILVRPGEMIGADGTVESGASEVDQASITGEPLPVDRGPGDEVFAGTVNGTGVLRVRVERRAEDSVVARIARMVEEAGRTKARTQLFIEKVEQRYSIGMVIATLAVFTIPLAFGEPVAEALLRAMTFMIVASPCALVLATMPPLLAVIANAGRHGVLVKSAVVLERLAETDRIAFDKTGTLTRGTPELDTVHLLGDTPEADVLRLVAGVEHPSEHPLGVTLVRAARERGIPVPDVREFRAQPGRGVSGTVDGVRVEVGSPALLTPVGTMSLPASADVSARVDAVGSATPAGTTSPPATDAGAARVAPGASGGPAAGAARNPAPSARARAAAQVTAVEERGQTAVMVLTDGAPLAILGITDRVRETAAGTVARAQALTGASPALLTGDNPAAAARLADSLGITDVRAGLLPEQKVDAVRELGAAGHRVLVVGDGVNDAPALAAAHTGVAVGTGADLTLRTADAVVVRDDLTAVTTTVALARRARRVVTANLVIAGTVIAVLVTWDLVGTLPLPLGVAGHEGSTILVALNGLRLLRGAAWERARG